VKSGQIPGGWDDNTATRSHDNSIGGELAAPDIVVALGRTDLPSGLNDIL
jgi:hypothetical protein